MPLLHSGVTSPEAHTSSCPMVTSGRLFKINWPGHKADCLVLSAAETENTWN
jgi:hypothetical protein